VLNKPVRGDLVILSVKLRMGDLQSLKGKDDIGDFAASMLKLGTSKMTRQQIDDAIVKLGAQINITGDADSINAFIRVKKDQLVPSLDLVAHLLKDSNFPEKEFEEARAAGIKGYEGAIADKTTQETQRFNRYGNPYPKDDVRYEATYEEGLAALKALKLADVKAFHKNFYGANSAYVIAVGPVEPKLVQEQIAKHFDGWKSTQAWTRIPYPLYEVKPTRMELDTPDKANATIRAYHKVPLTDIDDEALQLTMAMRIFGGGPGSRLWERMREKDGLSYSAGASVDLASREPNSSWEMFTEVNPANLSKAEAALKEELAKALKDGFTAAELARFKEQTLKTRRERRTGDNYAFGTLDYRFEYPERAWELGLINDAKYEAMTLEQVNAAFRKHVKPDALVWGLFRDPTKAK
jgi:zinc protease